MSAPVATDRFNVNVSFSRNWEHLQNKFVGTGHPDISRFDWISNHHRDSYATFLGHSDMLYYFSIAEGESVERTRVKMLEKMYHPCGNPPAKAQ